MRNSISSEPNVSAAVVHEDPVANKAYHIAMLPCSGGMIAPILGGHLLAKDTSLPMYTAAAILTAAAACVLLLPTEGENNGGNGYHHVSH